MGVYSYIYNPAERTSYELGKALPTSLQEHVEPFPLSGQVHVRRQTAEEWRASIATVYDFWEQSDAWLDRVAAETFWFCEAADWMVQIRSDAYDNEDEYAGDFEDKLTRQVRSVYDVLDGAEAGRVG